MENSKISWCHHTQNFWRGCTGAGCEIKADCYAAALSKRGGWTFEIPRATSPSKWREPFKWDAEARAEGKSYRVFCGSLMDFFDAPMDGRRPAAWSVIRKLRNLTWMVLTKQTSRIAEQLPADWGSTGYDNVWLGTTLTCMKSVHRLNELRAIPAVKKFVSCEPLRGSLAGVDFSGVDLIVAGGESGNRWKEHQMDLEWARELQTEAARTGACFFFKQVSSRFSVAGADALGAIHHEMPAGSFPWMPEIHNRPNDMGIIDE